MQPRLSTFREAGILVAAEGVEVPGGGVLGCKEVFRCPTRWLGWSWTRPEASREVQRLVESRSETFQEVSDLLFWLE